MYPGGGRRAANKALIEAHRARKSNARIYRRFPDPQLGPLARRTPGAHLRAALDEDGLADGEPRDLLAGTEARGQPGFAGRQTDTGEEIEIEFTPDNQAVVFARHHQSQPGRLCVHGFAAVRRRVSTAASRARSPRARTAGRGRASRPMAARCWRWSRRRGKSVYNAARLAAFPWPDTGKHRIVTDGIDRAVGSYAVSPDSRAVYFTAEDGGNEKLYSVRIGGGAVQTLFGVGEWLVHQPRRFPARHRQALAVRQLGERQHARRGRDW